MLFNFVTKKKNQKPYYFDKPGGYQLKNRNTYLIFISYDLQPIFIF